MTRYTYDTQTFRLLRQRSEKYIRTHLNGMITYAYDPGTNKQDDAFNYDLVGNILNIISQLNDCGIAGSLDGANKLNRSFSYDPLYRLLSATGRESDTQNDNEYLYNDAPAPGSPNANHVRAYTRKYTYDKLGNLQQVKQISTNGFTRNFNYIANSNKLDDIRTPANVAIGRFEYDAAGNQIKDGTTRHYIWDAANQLQVYKNQAGSSNPTVFAQYQYAGGSRVSKIVRTGTDVSPIYERIIYIDGIFEYHKLENGSTYEKNYVHVMDDQSRIAMVRIDVPSQTYPGDISESITYILEDQIGSSVARLNTDGSVIDKEEYYPFGDSSLRTFTKKSYRYVGKEKDAESGLYYYGARYYAAWTCRFISIDPLASDYPFYTPYNYAGNKPINRIDIDGMQEGEQSTGGDNGGGGIPVKKGDTFVGDDGQSYTASVDEVEVTGIATPKAENFNNINLDSLGIDSYPNYMHENNNVVTYNSIQNWFGGTAKNLGYDPNKLLKMSETEKQDFMQQGETETLLILMGEFATGTGPETRNFDSSNPMTQGLMRSLTVARGYSDMRKAMIEGNFNDNQTRTFKVPYSPDNAGLFNSLSYHITSWAMGNLSEFARGSVSMDITRFGDSAIVRLTDSYTISSASLITRAMGMATGQPAASNQNRVQGQYSPLGTTNQTYTWTIDLRSIILDYDSINR